MDADNTLTRAEESAERLALMVAQYYDALLRNNVSAEVALQLTVQYQAGLFTLISQSAARKAGAETLRNLFGTKP